MHLVLASGSAVRARLLRDAGLAFAVRPPEVDEDAVKRAFRAAGKSPADLALELARAKALARAGKGEAVIGADQVLNADDDWFDKPPDMAAARRQLLGLRGRTHQLTGGIAVAIDGAVRWTHVGAVAMTMRPFSEAFLDDYLARSGPAILSSVGGYQLEALGVHLFERIEGDYFAILGLALLPLLDFLRTEGIVPA
jgi:septum formation protein